jgi:chromosome segregation protein
VQIKRLRLAGFKSFVEPADLLIRDGLTGVVGPNGCGKSNLLEALRWTMGEASARSMRGAGMDDVIFAGTATRPPRDFAEVSILAEIAGEEREITRRIERGAGSAYRIDGRDVRAKDVGLLFADAATGAHSPALVSQNRIGAVIAAKPADRRQMLEEAARIAGLHVRRRDAEGKLRATEANLARLAELIADSDARAASLRRQARAAERYRLLSDRIRLAEARMIFARWRDAAAAADAAKAEAAEADARVNAASTAEREAAAARETAEATLAVARTEALAARDAAGEAGHALAGLRGERAEVDRRLGALTAAVRRLEEDRAREDALAIDAADALARLGEETRTLDAALQKAEERAPQLAAALTQAESCSRDAEVALARALAAQAGEVAEARVAAAALAAARTRLDRATRDAAEVAASGRSLPDAAPLAAERDAAASQRRDAGEAIATARAVIATAEAGEAQARAQRDAVEAARAARAAELALLDGEAAALERATRRSGAERLIDRMVAAPGYERALAAALGDELESEPDAWRGADPQPGDPPPPPGTTALSSHVAAPPALARRLAQVFVGTDTGQPLSAGQRLVTAEGALRRWDGYVATDTGAATAERLERLNRLATLRRERPDTAAALVTAEAARGEADRAIAAARAQVEAARRDQSRADASLRDAAGREDAAATRLDRLAGQRADLDARAARIAGERAEAEAEHARAAEAVAILPDGHAGAALVERLGREATAARTAVADARAAQAAADRTLHQQRERQAAAQAEMRGWRARAGEAARRIADMGARAAAIAADRDTLAVRPAALDADIIRAEAAHTAARAATDAAADAERVADTTSRATDVAWRVAAEALSAARELRAGAAARVENQELRRVEMGRLSGERFACPAPALPERLAFLAASVSTPAEESAAHERLAAERERIGPVNLVAERELAELEANAGTIAGERDELTAAVAALRGSIGTLNREGRQRLRAAFEAVNGHFRRLFTTLFDGGAAHLELIDSDDPLEAGLEIMAQPPGKRLQSLTLLSGGEQALTAVALIFALFLTNPAPICVLDEVDAPLDDANIGRFCDLLDRMARETDTRYLIVTHNAVTMSRMHRLFGVTMIERGVSRLVSVDLQAAERLAAE